MSALVAVLAGTLVVTSIVVFGASSLVGVDRSSRGTRRPPPRR